MNNYRFILEPYSSKKSKFNCPSCGKKNTFTRYIDLEKDEYLGLKVGICSRIQKCNYHYPPKDFFEDEKRISGAEKLPKVLMTAALKKAKLNPNEDNSRLH